MYYTEAIGLGLVISLIFFEGVGLAAGGMVVPGYVALSLDDPMRIVGTVLVAVATYALVRFLSGFMFIYGRRRIVVTILIAFILGSLCRQYGQLHFGTIPIELEVVGFIIPGLLANTMERQGVFESLSALFIAAVMVKMALILIAGGEVIAA